MCEHHSRQRTMLHQHLLLRLLPPTMPDRWTLPPPHFSARTATLPTAPSPHHRYSKFPTSDIQSTHLAWSLRRLRPPLDWLVHMLAGHPSLQGDGAVTCARSADD